MQELTEKEHEIIQQNRDTVHKALLRNFQRWMHRVEGTKPNNMECNFCKHDSRRRFSVKFFTWYDEKYN